MLGPDLRALADAKEKQVYMDIQLLLQGEKGNKPEQVIEIVLFFYSKSQCYVTRICVFGASSVDTIPKTHYIYKSTLSALFSGPYFSEFVELRNN